MGSGRLSAHQLAEFLAVVTSFRDERSATLGAVERAAEALEAERTLREESEGQAGEKADLAATREQRQLLLEKLLDIQRAISHRAPLQEVLDTITQSALELMGDDEAALRLIDPDDSEWHLTV